MPAEFRRVTMMAYSWASTRPQPCLSAEGFIRAGSIRMPSSNWWILWRHVLPNDLQDDCGPAEPGGALCLRLPLPLQTGEDRNAGLRDRGLRDRTAQLLEQVRRC